MATYYTLDESRNLVPADMMTWARWFENVEHRRVAEAILPNGVRVSTVFLGLDHNFLGEGPPHVFESMAFEPEIKPGRLYYQELDCERCSTWVEAEAQHAAMVEKFKDWKPDTA